MRENNRHDILLILLILGIFFFCESSSGLDENPAAWWTFSPGPENSVEETVSGTQDTILGNFRFVRGIKGNGLKFDGYTTAIIHEGSSIADLDGPFSIEAWIALAAYPWNKCPVVAQRDGPRGFSLEIGPRGEVILGLGTGDGWHECVSRARIPLKTWAHIAGTFDPSRGMQVYLDGEKAASCPIPGIMAPARETDLIIGAVSHPVRPSHPVGKGKGTLPSWYSLDAILDEVKIHRRALSAGELQEQAGRMMPAEPPDIPPRLMPSGPPGPGRFGAYYARLQYCWEWDDLWRVADHPDVVVRFDGSPVRVVFWRGMRYSPAWVTENGLWIADQSAESGNEEGCIEHMQDRHCRTSHVRIIENTAARTVVHWRYAPVSSRDNLWTAQDRTGWAWWVDEYYYFYPDGTGVRKIQWREPESEHKFPWLQIQETSILCHPGQQSRDVLNHDAITLFNMEGQSHTYSWPDDESENTRERRNMPVDPSIIRDLQPEHPNVQIVNYKSRFKPFIIFEPGNRTKVYVGRVRDRLENFPAYNHWPVNQTRSDGRFAQAPDRASSFSIAYTTPVIHEGKGGLRWAHSLYGMTDQPPERVIPLGRSWIHAPPLRVERGPLRFKEYDMSQRAYILEAEKAGEVSLILSASRESPLVNTCLLIRGWDSGNARILIDGKPVEPGKEIRTGFLKTMEGDDLLVWIAKTSESPVRIEIEPGGDDIL